VSITEAQMIGQLYYADGRPTDLASFLQAEQYDFDDENNEEHLMAVHPAYSIPRHRDSSPDSPKTCSPRGR
jgi:hypothetical protein